MKWIQNRYAMLVIVICISLLASMTSLAADHSPAETIDIEANEDQAAVQTIAIAALLPLSGELASKGEIRRFAIELSVQQANAYWHEQGTPLAFRLVVEDSHSDPERALAAAKELWKEGVRLFIAGSSAEVELLQPWAAEQGAIVISYSSTSPGLSIAGDSVFRMVPNDHQQAQALAALLASEGIYGVVPVYRDDIYGRELAGLLTEQFTQQYYGQVTDPITYEASEANWDEVMQRIVSEINGLAFSQERIAIVLLAFDEAAQLLKRSEATGEARWFGADTVMLSPSILADADAADRAAEVQLTGVTFGVPDSDLAEFVKQMITANGEKEYLPDAMFAYDIAGMLATMIEKLDDPLDTQELLVQFVELSAQYAGVTGWTLLDEAGDRKYYHYDIWQLRAVNDHEPVEYQWELMAKYLRSPGAPGYITPVQWEQETDWELTLSFLFGFEHQEFAPERELTRAEFTYMLMGILGRQADNVPATTFQDADAIDKRAFEAVSLAQHLGIINGYEDAYFRPSRVITFTEALVMMARSMEWTADDERSADESLEYSVPAWAAAYIHAIMDQGMMEALGREVRIDSEHVTLGDAALILLELMKRSEVD